MRGFAFNPNPDSITVSSQTFSDALTDSITVSSQTFSDALTESFTVSSQTFTNTLSGSLSGSVSGLFRRLAAVWRKRVERTDMLSKRKFL